MGFLLGQSEVEDSKVILFGLKSVYVYQSVYHLAAFDHPGLLGPPKSGIDQCGSVSGCGSSKHKVSDESGFSVFDDPGGSRDEDAEEDSVGPKADRIREFAFST